MHGERGPGERELSMEMRVYMSNSKGSFDSEMKRLFHGSVVVDWRGNIPFDFWLLPFALVSLFEILNFPKEFLVYIQSREKRRNSELDASQSKT